MIPRHSENLEATRRDTFSKRPFVIEIVHSILPKAKHIVVFRNPVDRFVSATGYFWTWKGRSHLGEGEINGSKFHEVVLKSISVYNECMEQSLNSSHNTDYFFFYCDARFKYLGYYTIIKGIYSRHLLLWWKLVSVDNLLIVRSEDLAENRNVIVKQVLSFLDLEVIELDLDHHVQANERRINQTFLPFDQSISKLQAFYDPFNKELATMLNNDKFLWQDG